MLPRILQSVNLQVATILYTPPSEDIDWIPIFEDFHFPSTSDFPTVPLQAVLTPSPQLEDPTVTTTTAALASCRRHEQPAPPA